MSHATRELTLNWLALGLLLAAWNSVDDGGVASDKPPRPAALRHYGQVSVRALQQLPPQKMRTRVT
jgi:hypothetical protein